MFPAYAITAVSAGAGCNRFIYSARPLFCTRCSFYAIGFSPFSSTLDCSATTNQDHLTESAPHYTPSTPLMLLSLSPLISLSYIQMHLLSLSPAAAPLPSLSLSLNLRSPSFGLGSSRQPGLLRSPTNLFDKSSRLIGWTTRGHGSFSKREIYRGNRFVPSYRPCIYSLAT